MAVSKKNCRKAVARNRLKRLIRENFRQQKRHLQGQGGFDYVVLPTAQAASICKKELTRSIQDHWYKAQGANKHPAKTDDRKNQ